MLFAKTSLAPGSLVAALFLPALIAVAAAALVMRARTVASGWRIARSASLMMVTAAIALAVLRAASSDRTSALVRSDVVGSVMLVLVAFVGWVVIRYSQAYIAGDAQERTYAARMLATIGAVAVVVIANDLILLAVAWAVTSLALHGLLTFFGDRPVAVAVAHKKFILARAADVAMVGGIVAFATAFETTRIDRIVTATVGADAIPASARIGIMLIVIAALLKCAQLPFHGWLIQVMEAPTPVSALLHAGVVNLGGFVLLRLAPVVDRVPEARTVLVVIGTLTAVLAALVMTTRISVKVALAWSTCAQMGFMLVQCGLGLWEMALLHLVAHSVYKAYAFLAAGSVVRQTQRKRLAPVVVRPTVVSLAAGIVAAAAGVLAAGWLWGRLPFGGAPSAPIWLMGGVVALAVVPLLAAVHGRSWLASGPSLLAGAFAVPVAYFALHDLFARLVPETAKPPTALLVFVGVSFVGLFVMQSLCAVSPNARFIRAIYPWMYGGLFLDESFTRVAFAVSPPPSAQPRSAPLPRPHVVTHFGPVQPAPAPDASTATRDNSKIGSPS